MAKAVWEKVTEDAGEKTDRLRVKGGWLYRTRAIFSGGSAPALAFVPDQPVHVLTTDGDVEQAEETRLHA